MDHANKMMVPIVMISQEEDGLQKAVALRVKEMGQPIILHVRERQKYDWHPERNRLKNIAVARNQVKDLALRFSTEWFFFLDDDILPPQSIILDLLKQDKKAIGGWFRAAKGTCWVGGRWVGDNVFSHFKEWQPGLTRTELLSLGCTLLHRSLLEKIEFESGADQYCKDVHGNEYLLADSTCFTNRLYDLGEVAYLDGSVICKHLKR